MSEESPDVIIIRRLPDGQWSVASRLPLFVMRQVLFAAFAANADDPIREALAALAHEQWSGWMRYLFDKAQHNDDGTVTLPAWAVARWQRQLRTPYTDLSESEKDSDRQEADRVLDLLKGFTHDRA
jgi:hypothetical protein